MSEDKDLNFSEDINIDKYRLDYELINAPQLHHDWAKAHVQALKEKDKAKARIDLVQAEVDEDIRTNWEEYGFDKKPTEAAIKQAIIKSEKFQKVEDEFIEATATARMLAHSLAEFDQRNGNLGHLVKLFLAGYYAESTSIHEDIVDKKLDNKTTKKIKEKLASKKSISKKLPDKKLKKKISKRELKKQQKED